MKAFLVTAVLIGAIPHGLIAQRGGGGGAHGGFGAHPGSGFGFGKGAGTGGRFGFGRSGFGNGWGRGWNNRNGFVGWGYGDTGWGDSSPFADPGWFGDYGDGSQPNPGTVFLMPQAPPPPPQPAHPVMHEYNWPADAGDAHATFSIVPKDGQERQAVAVWVQGNEVRYTDPAGKSGHIPPNAVDCGATDRLNTQKNLKLPLPGCGLSR